MSLAQKLRQPASGLGDCIGRGDGDGIEALLVGFGDDIGLEGRRIAI